MISTALPILSLVALSAAQSSTVSLFLLADPQSLVASIAGSDSTATTYVVQCGGGAAVTSLAAASASATGLADGLGSAGDDDCGFPEAVTVVQGPSTVHYAILDGDSDSLSINCQLMGSSSQAICTAAASGSNLLSDSVPPLTTATLTGTDYTFLPVVVTAGSVTAKQTGSSSPSPTGSATAKTTATGSTKSTGTGFTTSGATTGTSSSAQSQSTNAAMQGTPLVGAGIIGALGVAMAGAML